MGQLTFKSGSSYSASWEVRNTTLCDGKSSEGTYFINQ
jgi:hypothetical protein